MADYVHHPHDGLFRAVFVDIGEAQALLRSIVPRELAAFGQHRDRALEAARRSLTQLPPGPDVLYYLELFVRYVAGTQDDAVTREFAEVLRAHGRDPEGFIMSFAQKHFEEGMAKGRAEGEQLGRMKAVEGLLQNGATWDLIEKATGLNEAEYRALKERLS